MNLNDLPQIEATDSNGKRIEAETLAAGWHWRHAGGLTARVTGFADALLGRVAPGPDREVVQLGIGDASSRLCDAVYSPAADLAYVFQADDLRLAVATADDGTRAVAVSCDGPLSVTVMADYLRAHRGQLWYAPLDRAAFPTAPAGWCSWYEYYLQVTEDEIVKNTDWVAEHLKPFGCEWVQIDDGWQGIGTGYGSNRDWSVTCARDFPHGMGWIADYIRSKGLRPGLWIIPVTQSDPELFAQNPDLFLRRPDGTSVGEVSWPVPEDIPPHDDGKWVAWHGRYIIDPTSPDAPATIERLFRTICDEWGYDYVKIDGQSSIFDAYAQHRRQLSDPSLDAPRAMRAATSIMKRVLGPNRFLLNCLMDFTSSGICQGIRTEGDVDLDKGWAGILPGVDGTLRSLFLNTIAFYTDPDAVCVREPLPLEQAKLWCALVGITGQLLMASDILYKLPEERVELLRRIFPVADIRPMEWYPLDTAARPGIFDLKVDRPGVGRWDVVALFNWSETDAKTYDLSPKRLGLADGAWYVLGDDGALLHHGDGQVSVSVPPASCRVVSVWPDEGRPRVLGTNRHLTQGAVDLQSVVWDDATLTLSGQSHVVGGDPYRLRVAVPDGYRVVSGNTSGQGPVAEMTLLSPENALLPWRVAFGRG